MTYDNGTRVIVETSEGTHTAKVELDEGGRYLHVILDQGRYSDGRHRLVVSRDDVTPAPEKPKTIRAVDIPQNSLVSITEEDFAKAIRAVNSKGLKVHRSLSRTEQIGALREASKIGLHGYMETDEHVNLLTLPSAAVYLDTLHEAGYELVKR